MLEQLSSRLGIEVYRLVVFLRCTRCGRTWVVTVRDGVPLPAGWQVCNACGPMAAPDAPAEPAEEVSHGQ